MMNSSSLDTFFSLCILIVLALVGALLAHFVRTGRIESTDEQAEHERLERLGRRQKRAGSGVDPMPPPIEHIQASDSQPPYVPPEN